MPQKRILSMPEVEKPSAGKMVTKAPGEPAVVVPKVPKKKVQPPVDVATQKTAVQQARPVKRRKQLSDNAIIDSHLNDWGRIIIEPDACEHCIDDANNGPRRYGQTRIRCQLKTLMKIMLDNLTTNKKDNGYPQLYHKGIGHINNSLGVVTCRCKWHSLKGNLLVYPGHLHRYMKEKFRLKM